MKIILSCISCLLMSAKILFASSLFYAVQGGTNNGVYKVDMTSGAYEKIYTGSYLSYITEFDSTKVIVDDYGASKIAIINPDGSIYYQYTTPVQPHAAIRNPDNPDELLYTSFYSNQVRKINMLSSQDTYIASYTYSVRLVERSDGDIYLTTWGRQLYNLSTSEYVLTTSDSVTSIIADDFGNLYYPGHPSGTGANNIYIIDTNNIVSTFWTNTSGINLGGLTYDKTNNLILAFGQVSGQSTYNLYAFDQNANMTELLTGLELPGPTTSTGYQYALYLNDSNEPIVIPEPSSLLLLAIPTIYFTKRFQKRT